MKLDRYFTLYTKISSKWVKNLDIRPKAVRYKTGKVLCNIDFRDVFLDSNPMTRESESKGKCDFMKLKSLFTMKEMIIEMKIPF